MQGTEYITDTDAIETCELNWLSARDKAIYQAEQLEYVGVTKQLCNRLLEPFMWTTMLITGSKESWDNFFDLRCPQFQIDTKSEGLKSYKSKKEWLYTNQLKYDSNGETKGGVVPFEVPKTDLDWLKINKGQAEIHLMDLAEKIYDKMNESTPKQLQKNEWHIPFEDKLKYYDLYNIVSKNGTMSFFVEPREEILQTGIKVSVGMAARTSYTLVGDSENVDYNKLIEIHNKCEEMNHSSVFEHCARAMSNNDYYSFVRGEEESCSREEGQMFNEKDNGWCRNYKGFIQYRHILESNL